MLPSWSLSYCDKFYFLRLRRISARAAYVQSVNSETLSGEADKRSLRKDDVLSVRGSILDRNGQFVIGECADERDRG